MVNKIDTVHKNNKVSKVNKVAKSLARISIKNHERLTKLAGHLQSSRGKRQTIDDAITYLLENRKKEKAP